MIAGVGATSTMAPMAEILPPVFLFEFGIENVQRIPGWMVLANPHIAAGFDVENELTCQTAPIVSFVQIVLLARSLVKPRREECR